MRNTMSSREVIRMLEADGWVRVGGEGSSHQQFTHPTKPGKVTVKHPCKDIPFPTLRSIFEGQAKINDWRTR